MDALKRAEQNKQQAARGGATSEAASPARADTLSLEPIPQTRSRVASKHLPELTPNLEKVDEELAGASLPADSVSSAAPTSPPLGEQAERDAIRNSFSAKQVSNAPSRLPLWLTLGGLALSAAAIGTYVWFQLNALNTNQVAPPVARIPSPGLAATSPPPLPTPLPVPPAAVELSSDPSGKRAETSVPPPARAIRRQEPASIPKFRLSETPAPEAGIRFSSSRGALDKALHSGHANLRAARFDQAIVDFENVLQRAPHHTDALLALAAIAQHQGRQDDAEEFRQRAWIADPSDPAVQAAVLSGKAGRVDPQLTESRLKSLLAAQPDSAALNFAIGNLFAGQKRWSEAQQAYFNAVAADGNNPDYLFNLAVSLDQLRQTAIAARYYRMAIETARSQPAAFDSELVRKRLGEIQP